VDTRKILYRQAFETGKILRPTPFEARRILRPTAINEGNRVDINVIKIYHHQSKPSQFSWIVPQLKTVVGLNIFCMVLKELYFLKTKADKQKKNKIYVHIENKKKN
jgi:hypothetical protein